MPLPRPWKVVESQPLQDCRVFRVHRVLARRPSSDELHPFFCIDAEDWVNVVPVTAEGEIVMVRQYRHGSRAVTLEIPGGIVDPGETPAEAALRELREETGYVGSSVEPLGVVNPNPALFTNRVHSFLARDVTCQGPPENEGLEETSVELVSRSELRDRLRAGDIDHAIVLAGLYWFDLESEE